MNRQLSQEEHDLIDRISKEHCHNTFNGYNEDDLRNEIWVICLLAIDRYDGDRGKLEHYLRVAVKTRLINKYKSVTRHVSSPCSRCKLAQCIGKDNCKKYQDYLLRCVRRDQLMVNVDADYDTSGSMDDDKHLVEEVRAKLLENSDKTLVGLYNMALSGVVIPVGARRRLAKAVKEILYD